MSNISGGGVEKDHTNPTYDSNEDGVISHNDLGDTAPFDHLSLSTTESYIGGAPATKQVSVSIPNSKRVLAVLVRNLDSYGDAQWREGTDDPSNLGDELGYTWKLYVALEEVEFNIANGYAGGAEFECQVLHWG